MSLTLKWRRWLKNNNKGYLILYCLFHFVILSAQKVIPVSDIKGTALIAGDVSPNQARAQALNDAKLNALKAAGIGENINSYQLLFSSQQKNDYSQFFTSDIQSELQGAIQSYDVKSERTYCKNENEIVSEVILNAEVIKYDSKPDIAFDTNIEGVKAVYNNDSKLDFNVKTTRECYLTIFNITDKEAFMLYPNSYEKQSLLQPGNTYPFPTVRIDYTLHTDLKQQETNRLIFVFTKTQLPFIKMNKDQIATAENIFSWIYSITPDQRKVEYKTLTIQK